MRYSGRNFTGEEVQWIRDLTESNKGINRATISARFCEHFGWRKPDGSLKDMSCRVALLKMHRKGIITLLPTQRPFNRARKHTQRSLLTLLRCTDRDRQKYTQSKEGRFLFIAQPRC